MEPRGRRSFSHFLSEPFDESITVWIHTYLFAWHIYTHTYYTYIFDYTYTCGYCKLFSNGLCLQLDNGVT
ncbi:hypothetical protein EON65_15815 [archaeon]|nr:MAG: hypothetical protein EON65_15815 [archaeon]